MRKPPDYSKLVSQAELAVQGVKDPELKRAAFEKILDDLLAATSPGKKQAKTVTSEKSAKTAPRKTKRGPRAYIEELVGDGFFRKPKTITQVRAELGNRGHHVPLTSLSGPLQILCQRRKLRRQKVKTGGKKVTFAYSEW